MQEHQVQAAPAHSKRLVALLCATALAAGPSVAAATTAGKAPPFIPIEKRYLPLPEGMQPFYPTYFDDSRQILFTNLADGNFWLIRADGSDLKCVTCGFDDKPKTGGFFTYAFPDGKRLLITAGLAPPSDEGPGANAFVLECAPSLRACDTHRYLPVDASASRGAFAVLQRRTWHLAPDGEHVGWMEVRAAGTVLVAARLERRDDRYVAADPRAINPAGPRSNADTDPDRWENLTQLYELKSFTPDGKGAIIVALPNHNIDMLRVDLETGKTTRLTAHPDWDEDGSLSPDEASLVSYSWRGRHRMDAFAWIPQIRGYGGLMLGAAIAPYYVSTWEGFQCDLSPWLLPARGDDGGRMLGQPLDVYTGDLTAAGHQLGPLNWSQDSTTLILQERSRSTLKPGPNRIALAHLDRAPTAPRPVVRTVIGDWAPPAGLYRGPHAEDRTVIVRGRAGGQATLKLTGKLGGGGAATSVVFDRFTDDGETFVSGAMSQASDVAGEGERRGWTLKSDLAVTGHHTGRMLMDLKIDNAARPLPVLSGTLSAVYDGRTAPPLPPLGACYDKQPKPTPLRLDWARAGGAVRAKVTADIAGDVRPVMNATLRVGTRVVKTNARGEAEFVAPKDSDTEVVATAGDTFLPARARFSHP
jgi:hypothetical protein